MQKPIDESSTLDPQALEGTVALTGARRTFAEFEPGNSEPPASSGRTGERISAAPLSASEEQLISETVDASRYSILGKVGAGGMATVYVARDRSLLRLVALKVQHGEAEAGANARFLEEAQVLGQLEHPNIVPLYTLESSEKDASFSTMRYLRGSSLHDVLRYLGARDAAMVAEYSLTRLMQIFLQITQAVSYAHHQGVIHRDLKPANVMLGEHGEVQVVDWGIAKVRSEGGVQTDSQRGLTVPGQIMGTPAYMAPEQWAGAGIDERADIYSLGVILYEMLTLKRPFDASNPLALCRDVLATPPKPPRLVAPERSIPLELQEACLKALSKLPEERQAQVKDLYRAVQAWLETETDKARRHALSEEKVTQARDLLHAFQAQRSTVADLEREAQVSAGAFSSWQSVAEKRSVYAVEEKAQAARRHLIDLSTDVVGVLTEALGFERENSAARELLADYYWDRLIEAEEAVKHDEVEFYVRLVRRYHDGKYARQLSGQGRLTLRTQPAGAQIRVSRLEELDLRLRQAGNEHEANAPLDALPLGPGSYVATIELEGYTPVTYPVYISRNREWDERVELYREQDIAPGFRYVPGGPFIEGGDTEGWSLPRSEPHVADFAIAQHPVTVREYLEFLNELAKVDLPQALRRAPRRAPDGGFYATHRDGRGFELEPNLPDGVSEASAPVSGVSWYDAIAYCEWRSSVDGRSYRLPSAREWEKAARGVDGRWFPWGNRFDASLCNIRESNGDGPRVASVSAFPTDESVYGVRGMAGNMRDWTDTASPEGADAASAQRVVRGGAWYGGRVSARCADRFWFEPNHVYFFVGFRLAHSFATPRG